jgi:hypothetical protein
MKISDLTPEQLEILADNRPDWMVNNRLYWMVDNRPDWMANNRPDWMANNRISVDVPEDLVKLLEKYHV